MGNVGRESFCVVKRFHYSYGDRPPNRQVNEDTLKSEKIAIERKTFMLTLRENPRGRFLRITEDVNGRRDSIIVPSTGLDEFCRVFAEMARASATAPNASQGQTAL
jgi:hypothetical protein